METHSVLVFSFVKKNATLGLFCIFLFGSKMFVLKYKHFHRSHSSVPFGEKFSPYGYTFSISPFSFFLKKKNGSTSSFFFFPFSRRCISPTGNTFRCVLLILPITNGNTLAVSVFLLSSPHETHSVVFCRVSQELDKNTFRCVFFRESQK